MWLILEDALHSQRELWRKRTATGISSWSCCGGRLLTPSFCFASTSLEPHLGQRGRRLVVSSPAALFCLCTYPARAFRQCPTSRYQSLRFPINSPCWTHPTNIHDRYLQQLASSHLLLQFNITTCTADAVVIPARRRSVVLPTPSRFKNENALSLEFSGTREIDTPNRQFLRPGTRRYASSGHHTSLSSTVPLRELAFMTSPIDSDFTNIHTFR
jgi:hypothetical protein